MAAQQPLLFVRADGNAQMGTGHLMRCLALAQAWRDQGGSVSFVLAPGASGLEPRLQAEKIELLRPLGEPGSAEDATELAGLASRARAAAVVLDGYHFGAQFQRAMKEAGLLTLAIDDNGHAEHYFADFVLNQNLHARPEIYASREPSTLLLLGPQYALLRREFRSCAGWRREVRTAATRALVTMGGSDPNDCTSAVICGLEGVPQLEAVVVLGAANPHEAAVRRAAAPLGARVRVVRDVEGMPELMTWADLAVAGAGTTSWELAALGLPSVLIVTADNQWQLAEGAAAAGIADNAGWYAELSTDALSAAIARLAGDHARRVEMSRRGQESVDAAGAARVASALLGRRRA